MHLLVITVADVHEFLSLKFTVSFANMVSVEVEQLPHEFLSLMAWIKYDSNQTFAEKCIHCTWMFEVDNKKWTY